MLARKYYAQKGNSRGPMNTVPVAGSGVTSRNNRKNTYASGNFYGPEQNRKTSGIHTQIITQNTSGCVKKIPFSENQAVASSCYARTGIGSVMNIPRKVCYIHKDYPVVNSSEQVILHRQNRSCPANDPVPVNNAC
jgi:hypothetical protein